MTVSKTSTIVQQWQVYPRVHYFRKRLLDLHPRFTRVIGQFPKSFGIESQLVKIETNVEAFKEALEVIVVGNRSLEPSHYVVDTKPLEEQVTDVKNAAGERVIICYVRAERLDDEFSKNIDQTLAYFNSFCKSYIDSMFIVIDVVNNTTQTERQEISKHILTKLDVPADWDLDRHLCFGLGGTAFATHIAVYLEVRLMSIFHMLYRYLGIFVPRDRILRPRYVDVASLFKSNLPKNSMRGLIHDLKSLKDMDDSAEAIQSMVEDKNNADVQNVLTKLARMVKCNLLQVLSKNYLLTPSIINSLLEEKGFESYVKSAVEVDTKKAFLRQIVDMNNMIEQEEHMQRSLRTIPKACGYLLALVIENIRTLLTDVQSAMKHAEQIVMVMHRMMFEIEGYLEQTITEEFKPMSKPPSVPEKMKHELLQLDNVHSVATVYDEFEIHLYLDHEAMEVGLQDSSPERLVEGDIASVIKKYNFKYPYKVKTISRLPKQLAVSQHENGNPIQSPWPGGNPQGYRCGTLGAFGMSIDGELYGFTCAHVVNGPDGHEVFVSEAGTNLRPFAVSSPTTTISFGHIQTFPLIDIAAIRILDEMTPHCIRLLKDDDGMNRNSLLCTAAPATLVKRHVYKHGATTDLTHGIVASANVQVSSDANTYLLMVEDLPGSPTKFAKPGDSGSIVCMANLNPDASQPSDHRPPIQAVSMVHAGDMEINGEPGVNTTFTFMLHHGLDLLLRQSQQSFTIE